MTVNEIEYRVYSINQYGQLFSIYARRFPKRQIINELEQYGYHSGMYRVEWETETTYNARGGRRTSIKKHKVIIILETDEIISSQEQTITKGRAYKY